MSYAIRREWSDGHIPKVKNVILNLLVQTSSEYLDRNEATDLTFNNIFGLSRAHIAMRVRSASYFEKFSDELTLRCKLPSNTEPELTKIISGKGDFIFYGFIASDGSDFLKYIIGDLRVFRSYYRMLYENECLPRIICNRDGTAFMPFSVSRMPNEFIVASGGTSQKQASSYSVDDFWAMP